MKSYYIYARLNHETLRVTASLYNQAPEGYYAIEIINAKNQHNALINFMTEHHFLIKTNDELILSTDNRIQLKFLRD